MAAAELGAVALAVARASNESRSGAGRDGGEDRDDQRTGLVAVTAPTTLAIETSDQAGITLIAAARDDGFEVFTHPDRVVFSER